MTDAAVAPVEQHEPTLAAPIDDADIRALSDEDLKKLVDSEWTRAKELDDKLQKLTAALSVSVTVGGLVATTILQDLAWSGLKLAAVVLFLFAALLLFGGVLLGFNGLRPKPRHGYGAAFMRKVATGGGVAKDALVAAAGGFQRDNMIRANEASAATASIRNGIVIFVVAVVLGAVAAAAGKTPPSHETSPAGAAGRAGSHRTLSPPTKEALSERKS